VDAGGVGDVVRAVGGGGGVVVSPELQFIVTFLPTVFGAIVVWEFIKWSHE
jgi:hypothetical protein